jgi:hypothetical protein
MEEPATANREFAPSDSPADSADPNRQEIRLAVVLNGGVSLAVWISGVTLELHRLAMARREKVSIYRPVLELQTRTRISTSSRELQRAGSMAHSPHSA